ncbi:MAG: DUF924 domain-containing protein [Bdellovibrionales bacterium]|nr:DUF924 domain-containing protein [Bdellovibrionales bacterium]
MQVDDVIHFWFSEVKSSQWWKKDLQFDQEVGRRFINHHAAATKGELDSWRNIPEGRLAEIIILDQFSRNMFRDQPKAFAFDGMALLLAQEAVRFGADKALNFSQKSFLYMPFMHSESLKMHEVAVELFSQPGLEFNLDFEYKHKKIIERFGRYPHRNKILGRLSTSEEIDFLNEPGSSF